VSEITILDATDRLSEVARLSAESGSVIYLTDHGRRLVAIVPAVVAERLERDDARQVRARLAEAGLLDPVRRLTEEAPAEKDVEAARARAGQGSPLSEYVTSGRR
jgi:hypothetical protein